MSRLYAVKHVITGGNQFDRQVPTTDPVDTTDGRRVYPADSQGGGFDFNALAELVGDAKIPWMVHEILLDLSGPRRQLGTSVRPMVRIMLKSLLVRTRLNITGMARHRSSSCLISG